MKLKNIITFVASLAIAEMAMAATPQGTFQKSENATIDDIVCTYRDSFAIYRSGDSVFIGKQYSGKIVDAAYCRSLTSLKPDGTMSYDPKGIIYYSKCGKIYAAKEKDFGKFKSGKKQWIPGVGQDRNEFQGSMLAYASWRYMPKEESIIKNPSVTQNGKTLYFSSNAEGSKGWDIWTTSINEDGEWSPAERLGKEINSLADEDYPVVIGDSLIAFASNRKGNVSTPDSGKFDIYVSKLDDWKRPIAYEKYVNTPEEELVAVVNDARSDSTLADNKKKDDQEFNYDDEEDLSKSENARILELLNEDPKIEPTKKVSVTTLDEMFKQNQDTVVRASKNVIATADKRIFYFDYDKDVVNNKDYEKDIEVILDFINFYPKNSFLVIGHTDERGSYEYNDALSMKRARKIESILVSKGVSRKRLFTMGLGEYKPVFKNAKTEEQHQKNRRVEILIMD